MFSCWMSSILQMILCCSSQTLTWTTLTTNDLKTAFSLIHIAQLVDLFHSNRQLSDLNRMFELYINHIAHMVHVTCPWAAVRDIVCFSTCQCGTHAVCWNTHMFQQTEPGILIQNLFSKTNQVVFVPQPTHPPEPPEPMVARLISVKPQMSSNWTFVQAEFSSSLLLQCCVDALLGLDTNTTGSELEHIWVWIQIQTHLEMSPEISSAVTQTVVGCLAAVWVCSVIQHGNKLIHLLCNWRRQISKFYRGTEDVLSRRQLESLKISFYSFCTY